jgi:hypothetical protein
LFELELKSLRLTRVFAGQAKTMDRFQLFIFDNTADRADIHALWGIKVTDALDTSL